MKFLQTLLPILGLIVLPSVQAQPVSTATFGSTVAVWSGHTTVRERVDAGVDERIELWNRAWIVSPSGQVHENTAHWGFGASDGYAATTVTFTETGRWTYWASDGGSIDTFVYGDSPWAWYMFPHNPPNGVGYGGAGRRVTAFIDVEAPTTYALTTSVSGSGSVSGGGNYSAGSTVTVTATPGSGHAFAGWQGALSGTANPASITMDAPKSVTAVFVALNSAPTVTWSAAPSSAASGQVYTITAHGHDADGNLTQVNVWKNGAPFAFSGGGNGTDGDSGNATSDTGPTTITYTAQAVDGAGATSATISHTVSVSAANRAPTITWTSTPGTVASGQNYTVSARGHDDDGNLTQVTLWKNGAPCAFAGGGNGTDGDSGNATFDSGPATITYTAEAVDANGARSATISQVVTIGAPPTVTASISANPTSADAPGATTITWSSANATSVSVSGNGVNSSATSGSQAVSGLPAGTYTYTITAQGTGGPVTQTATFTVNAVASVSASISASPTSATAPGASTISWSSANATSVSVSGSGLSSTSASGSQAVSGLSAGTYVYTITAQGPNGPATQTATVTVNAPANSTPTISWNTTPGSVANGQNYTVSAHGHDADGNLAQVNVWKNGAPFAFAGGGNGTDGDSGNTTSDAGPATITFTANAVDALGATAATITQTVTVAAPLAVSASISASPTNATVPGATTITWSSNNASSVLVSGNGLNSSATSGSQMVSGLPAGTYTYTITAQGTGGPVTQTATFTVNAPANNTPTISWNTTPGSVANGQNYTVSARGHDADGNLTQVNVWKNGAPFAFAGGGNGTDGDSGNTTSDAGPATITFTANAVDALGATAATITQTVTVAAPLAVSASISASPATTTTPGSTTITWSSNNATSVSVAGPGLNSTALIGSQAITGLAAGSHDYTITAQGPSGPVVQTATVTVSTAATVSGTISTSPATGTEPASTTVAWNTSNAAAVVVSGPGLSSTADSGSQTVSGLTAGTHTYTLTAQGPGGPITRTATFTVSAAVPNVSGSIAASPTTTTAPGSTTITWTTANATSVSVSGPGLATSSAVGSQNVTGLPAGSHSFTLVAQGNGGPLTRTVTVTVNAGANVTAAISVSPATMNMGGTATLTWSTANATSVRVTGFGVSGSGFQANPNMTLNIGGLPPGQSTWTLVAEGTGGPLTRTATINVNSIDGLYGSLTASPAVIYSNQSASLAWTSSGANFKWVHGQLPGFNGVSVYPAPVSGSAAIPSLPPGEYSFVFEYGPGAFSSSRMAFAYLTVLGVNRTVFVSTNPAGAGLATGGGSYAEGGSVTLTATPDANHVFSGWSGDLTGSNNPLTFTVGPQNYSITANFALRTHTVAASVAPVGAGTVSGAGTYNVGTTATLTAVPDATHNFTGWTGDVSGSANPLTVVVNGNVSVVANFAASSFALTTAATAGGSVTPGGTYPAGTVVTVSATPDATHRFVDWTGDATGTVATTAVTLDRAKFVQANFTPRSSQTISFAPPRDHGLGSLPFTLLATATSGLPVSFSLLSGPAILTGSEVQVTGAGPVTLQATQPGDAFFLPAPPVNQMFNVIGAATLKYRGQSRTLLRDEATREAPPYVLENP